MKKSNSLPIAAMLAVHALVASPAAVPPVFAQTPVRVVFDDGRPDETLQVWTFADEGDVGFVRASDVARLFRATQFWNASNRKVVFGLGKVRLTLTVDTRVVVAGGEPVMMRTPTRYDGGFVMVPMEFITEIASEYTPRSFALDADARVLRVGGVTHNVTSVRFSSVANRTTAVIELTEPLLYNMDTSAQGLVRLKLYGGRADARAFEIHEKHGLVLGARSEQSDRDAFLYFDIDPATHRVHIDRDAGSGRLTLTFDKGELPEIPEPDLLGRETIEIVDRTTAERRNFKIERVCIDPGHGGRDLGKVGISGVLEKDVNLQLAVTLRDRIKSELGLEVFMTRTDDELVPLVRRTEIANEGGASIFISIHCNSWFSERTGGFEAYFLSPARSESDRALQRFENAAGSAAPKGPNGDIEFILWDLVQNEFINESSTLAEYVQKEMDDRLRLRNRGVKQANFTVLQGAKMPAILIETAFLSNRDEERMLNDPQFQRTVADGIVEALRRFQDRYR